MIRSAAQKKPMKSFFYFSKLIEHIFLLSFPRSSKGCAQSTGIGDPDPDTNKNTNLSCFIRKVRLNQKIDYGMLLGRQRESKVPQQGVVGRRHFDV